MVVWIEKTLALAIHDRQLAEHGGASGIRDDSLLESALARPKQMFAYGHPPPDLADLAASLAHAIARNHPFVDGNKRTAHVSYRVFLALNDASLIASDEEKYATMMGLAEGTLSEREFADWLRQHVRLDSSPQVNESAPAFGDA
ncbi:type II toxin-antitoxin system death-on-curing family toxin [Oleiagrimonas sp. C23AA]|uniref:type II toxin-antitoxin system death-on-curing family toxin n=1 Tax=Oleiagrimonas sp. C23AA TaxID=2719047 RepID=UPI0014240A5F|nr:type II toxin-antitoxin system death-on-curing family toxin [Oleiagrimonas sp. C23AA]NII11753.1 type II toxin-antitoxin system death-on-curing family toxin [Oleiagrimonas sp. C23AA]